ncbi:MAG: twitching motility protein [Desulfocapsaceae bacterium]|nr:twitching motility protein [Desulfocapsaceae bacterium]
MMELKNNQAALILEVDEDGGVSVNVASGDDNGPAGAICQAIAVKLMQDEAFQAEIMDMLEVEEREAE